MFAIFNFDGHFAREAGELICAGVRNDRDIETGSATIHGPDVLEREAATSSCQAAGYFFDGDIGGRVLDSSVGSKHLAFAYSLEIAVKLFVEKQSGDAWLLGLGGGLRSGFYVERSFGSGRHGGSLLGLCEPGRNICEHGGCRDASAGG